MVQDWLAHLQQWWVSLSAKAQTLLTDAALLLLALVAGKFVGIVVKNWLRGWGVDRWLRSPWASVASQPKQKTSADAIGYLCVGTVWAGALWGIATQHALTDIARTIGFVTGRVWTLALIISLTMGVSHWLSQTVAQALRAVPFKSWLEAHLPPSRESPAEATTRLLGFAIYGFFSLLLLMVVAELFGLNATAQAIGTMWELLLRLVLAALILGVGWWGVQQMQKADLIPTQLLPVSPESAAQTIRLGFLAVVLLFALAILTGSGSEFVASLLWLAFFSVLLLALAPVRKYLPDLWAGVALKMHKVERVFIDGVAARVLHIGVLATRLLVGGAETVRPNQEVLEAFLHQRSPLPPQGTEGSE